MSLGVCAAVLLPSGGARINRLETTSNIQLDHELTGTSKIFQYVCKEWRGLSKHLSWFSEDALRNDNRGRCHAGGRATALAEVHSMLGRGSGPSSRGTKMNNWNYGLQLCRESQEWYMLLQTFFVPGDAIMTPAPDGKARVFKFNSGIYLDLDEDPDARRQRLKLEQKIHDEEKELAAEKPVDKRIPSHLRMDVSRADGEDGVEQSTSQKNLSFHLLVIFH